MHSRQQLRRKKLNLPSPNKESVIHAKVFIERPIFAWVIAIITMLAGLLAIMKLPVAQYPTVAPPAISISATYPCGCRDGSEYGNPVIEQNMNGIDKMVYMSSTSDSAGNMSISLTFEADADPDIARFRYRTNCSWLCRYCRRKCSNRGYGSEINQLLPVGCRVYFR